MGRRGPLPKPPERAQGHRRRGELVALPAPAERSVPDPPDGLSEANLAAWQTYWASEVARVATDVDLPAIRRLFTMYEQYEKAMRVVDQALAVKGSTGQIRLNPLADYAAKLDGQILRLEAELGLTPMSRQRLGLVIGQKALTLEQVNRLVSDGHEDPDPRLETVEADAAGQ